MTVEEEKRADTQHSKLVIEHCICTNMKRKAIYLYKTYTYELQMNASDKNR